MKKIQYILVLLAACLLLTSCRSGNHTTTTTDSKSTATTQDGVTEPVPELLSFDYGRLVLENRFLKINGNGIDFTMNFDKKIITPGDDIVLTVYVANYTGGALDFKLENPIVSRQQLIHASLTYGGGLYSVPVTVEFSEEADLVGGAFDVNIRDRKLLATTVTFHTSAYENIEESIFHQDFADTYEMAFWFGEEEYTYRAQPALTYQEQGWEIADELQSLTLPEQYVGQAGDVRFTLSFNRATYGTDDDIRMHVIAENLGKEPINLAATFDISDPANYVRAELSFGEQNSVRDNVANPSEIAGFSSQHLLKHNESLERDIVFYTSEFNQIKRSVYHNSNFEKCVLRVWLLVDGQTCEIEVPLSYGDYLDYTYTDREVPPIIVIEPEFTETTTTVLTTTRPVETEEEPAEITTEPAETTAEPAETTAEPAETTAEPAETTAEPAETTAEPAEPAETTDEPAETTADPAETTDEPAETTAEPAETTEPDETTAEPAETTAEPAETTDEPVEAIE